LHDARIASVELRQGKPNDLRAAVVVVRFESGRKIEHAFRLTGVVLYEEVWDQTVAYERGDCVTYDGSMWIAMRDTKEKPGESKSWRLSVKRGRSATPPKQVTHEHDGNGHDAPRASQ
jgi:hypothetical protein